MSDVCFNIIIGLTFVLFGLGIYGLISSRDILKILLAIEVSLLASLVLIVLFASMYGSITGYLLALVIMFVADAEAAVTTALAIFVHRQTRTIDVGQLRKLREHVS